MSRLADARRSKVLVREFEIRNRLGIHARPAKMIVQASLEYDSDVQIEKDDTRVSGKSIIGLITLAAECGSRLRVTVEGPDGEALLDELEDLIVRRKFDEE